ncbi:MAG: STN domain-containing protein [Bacteroidales bacterium]|nr:STN domain-containing protein [Bacteroidales bacterium]
MNIKKCILCVSALISFMASYAQTITYSASNKSLTDVLHDIEQISSYRFSYNSDIIQADKTISITITNASINAFLAKILPSKYNYSIVGTQVIITEKKQQNIVQNKRPPTQSQQKEKTILVYDTIQVIDHVTVVDTIFERKQVIDTLQHVEVVTQQLYKTSNLHSRQNSLTLSLHSGPLSNSIKFYNSESKKLLQENHSSTLSYNIQFNISYKKKDFVSFIGIDYYNNRLRSFYTTTTYQNDSKETYTDTLWFWKYREIFTYYKFSESGDSVRVTALDSIYTYKLATHQKKIEENNYTNTTLSWHYISIPIGIGLHFTPTKTFVVQPFISLNTMLMVAAKGEIFINSDEIYPLSKILKPVTCSSTIACNLTYAIEKKFAVSVQPYCLITPSIFKQNDCDFQGFMAHFGLNWGFHYTIPYDIY